MHMVFMAFRPAGHYSLTHILSKNANDILKSTEMGILVTYFQFLDSGIIFGFTIHHTDSFHQILHLEVRLLHCSPNLI